MFGLARDGRPLRAIVGEYIGAPMAKPYGPVLGPEHKFSLLSTARAGHVLAVWASTSGTERGLRAGLSGVGGGRARVIEVFGYRSGQLLSRERVHVAGVSEPFEVARQRLGSEAESAAPCTRDDLARLITPILTEAAQ